jgi:hypothetical protein
MSEYVPCNKDECFKINKNQDYKLQLVPEGQGIVAGQSPNAGNNQRYYQKCSV